MFPIIQRATLLGFTFFFSLSSSAFEQKGVKIEDELTVGEVKLGLASTTLRRVKKFGLKWHVYVGGLYSKDKNLDPKVLYAFESPVVIFQKYVRDVDKKALKEGWGKAVKKSCIDNCEAVGKSMKKVIRQMKDMKKGKFMKFTLTKSETIVDIQGRGSSVVKVQGPEFSKFMLDVFIGPKALKELKKDFLTPLK